MSGQRWGAVPEALRALPGWLVWRLVPAQSPTSKPRKVPFYAGSGQRRGGTQGSPSDRAQLVAFDVAVAACERGRFNGIGLAMLPEWSITALDFDKCVRDGRIDEAVARLITGTYAEISPSGTGVRAFVRGALGDYKSSADGDRFGFETFTGKGFVTVTGMAVGQCRAVEPPSTALLELVERRFGESREAERSDPPPLGLSEEQIRDDLLAYLDPAMPRDPWLKVGMAIHHETRGAGFDLWDEWSAQAPANIYPGRSELQCQWNSFDRPRPDGKPSVTIRSLIDLANKAGAEFTFTAPVKDTEFSDIDQQDRDAAGQWIEGLVELAAPGTATDVMAGVRGGLPYAGWAKARVDDLVERLAGKTGRSVEEVRQAIGATRPIFSDPVELDLAALPEDPPDVPFVIPGWMPDNVVTLFAAHGGTGKSYISLFVAMCLATGRHPFADGVRIPRVKVVIYSAEDGVDVLQIRLRRYMRMLGIDTNQLAGWLMVLDATASENVLFSGEERGPGRTTKRFEWLRDRVAGFGARVLIFDNASDALDANENDRAKVRQFMTALKRLAPAVLLLAHVDAISSMADPAAAKGYSGSTGWHNSARSRWFMARDPSTEEVILSQPKVNYAAAGSQATIRWDDGHQVFTVVGVRNGRVTPEDHRPVLLALLREAVGQGREVSPAKNTSNSVFNTLRDMPGFPGRLTSGEVFRELNIWLQNKLVEICTVKAANRKEKRVLALTEAGLEVAEVGAPSGELV